MKRGYWMRLFYQTQRQLVAERSPKRRQTLARVLAALETKVASTFQHTTIAWMADRKPDYYLFLYEDIGWPVTRTEYTKVAA